MCDCEGEAWSSRPLRVIAAGEICDDPGERVYSLCEAATGSRPVGCPWWSLRDPFVAETVRAYGWREAGQLEVKYPLGVPARIVWGVEVYASALNSVRVFDIREREAERQRHGEERAMRNT